MLSVDGSGQLSLFNQGGWSVHNWQHNFDHSDLGVLVEFLVLGQLVPFTGGGDSVVFVVLSTEGWQQGQVVPALNVVVAGLLTVNQSFNGVTIVVQDEQVWLQAPSDHGGDFLDGQLQGTVTNEQDDSLLWVNFFSGEGGTQTGTSGETDGTP